jgi:glycosyltransferase involved in cell wall biosynthesis
LVIDNNCTDNTPLVLERFAGRLPLRRIIEPKQGASHGRNRAIAEFSGDVLLFADDDVTLAPDWLAQYAIALKRYPDADIFGGRIIAAFEKEKPKWLVDCNLALLSGVLVNLDYGEDLRLFAPNEPGPWSASLAVRRRVFERVGGLRVDLGPTGLSRGRADDTEFIDRALKRGAERVYVGGAVCWHRVSPNRLSLRALYRHGLEKGRAHALMDGTAQAASLARAFSFAIRGLGQIAKGRGDRARQCVINLGMVMGLRRSSRTARRIQ